MAFILAGKWLAVSAAFLINNVCSPPGNLIRIDSSREKPRATTDRRQRGSIQPGAGDSCPENYSRSRLLTGGVRGRREIALSSGWDSNSCTERKCLSRNWRGGTETEEIHFSHLPPLHPARSNSRISNADFPRKTIRFPLGIAGKWVEESVFPRV